MISTRIFRTSSALALGLSCLVAPLASADQVTIPTTALPGVDAAVGDSVVPGGKTRPDGVTRPSDLGAGWVRIGDWDVKVSGSVTIDIGTTGLPSNTR